jgi:TIGR03009 family protein
MDYFVKACLVIAVVSGAAAAQSAPPAAGNQLDGILERWEQEMRSIQTISAKCVRTSLDNTAVMNRQETFEGTAKYMKPNLAMLEMRLRGRPDVFEKFICTGTYLYEYAPANRQIRVHELPPAKPGQVADDNLLSFLFGMKAEEAHRRYALKLAEQDQWYYYVDIQPRFPQDKADFQKARLVLNKQSFLPRQLWFMQPNGNEIRWDIPKIESGVAINRQEFLSPQIPQGWQLVRVPRPTDPSRLDGPPRVVRPNR